MTKHLAPLSVLHLDCLTRILGISMKDHVANVDILSECQVPYVESQLRSKRLRWYGHVCRQADDRLTKCMLFGQVKGPGHVGKPRKIWNDVVLSDIHHRPFPAPVE